MVAGAGAAAIFAKSMTTPVHSISPLKVGAMSKKEKQVGVMFLSCFKAFNEVHAHCTLQREDPLVCHASGPVMIYTLIAFTIVQIGIWKMINTAREACSDAEQRRRLQFLRNVTPHVWNIFWAMWFCQYFGILSVFQAELGTMFGNFVAKVK